jgi:ATP-binding cassette subfamily F protein 3
MSEVTFGYTPEKLVLKNIYFDVGLDSRIAMVGANGAGKSTVYVECGYILNQLTDHHNRIKILTGELNPVSGHVTRNGRLRMFVNHYCHVDRRLVESSYLNFAVDILLNITLTP